MSRNKWVQLAAGVTIAAGAGFLTWREWTGTRVSKLPESGYVNPAACAGCHSEVFKSYRLTGMGQSLYRPTPENMVEDFKIHNTLYNRTSDRYYTMIERDGRFYERRHQIGYDGNKVNVIEKRIDYVMGSGNHVRSYLSRTAQGTLVELPVSWYAENGGYWAMSPGYDRADQDDFRRTIVSECMFCHTAYPVPDQGANLTTDEPLFGDHIPEGIDCQRCHGPGRAHVEAASSGHATIESIRAAIVNPARLSRDRQLEVCMQCHLETTHFPLPGQLLRYSRQPFSYRPGEPLEDYELFFDHASGTGHDDKFEIVSAAYRLRRSACFQSSQMTCTTCHNPHSVLRPEQAAAHYSAVCRNCHPSVHQSTMPESASSCVDCHMAKRRPEDVVHTVITDHYIQRHKPARDPLKPIQEADFASAANYQGEVVPYYPPGLPRTHEDELYIDVAQVYYGSNLKFGILRLKQDLIKYKPDHPEFYVALGDAELKVKNYGDAIDWFDEALRRRPDFVPALEELGGAFIAAGKRDEAIEVLEKAALSPSARTAVFTNLGGVYLATGNLEKATQVLRKVLHMNPDLPEAHNFLGLVMLEQHDLSAAEKEFREAISIQPDLAEAQYNLGNVLAAASDSSEAAYHFEKAIAARADYAVAHHHLGVLLAQMGSNRKALTELEDAVRLDPNSAEAYSDLASVLVADGRPQGAADAYRKAIGLNDQFYEAHLGLAQILAQQGSFSEARTQFEEASQSPDPLIRSAAQKGLMLTRAR
ncbi:MAG TPA: tetratricopeptide repeat protein [Bryobacteraceae bacterium]|nr:tetratricopeptide repeat protein [Bryobacteraceae bacterium]